MYKQRKYFIKIVLCFYRIQQFANVDSIIGLEIYILKFI